MDSMEEKDCNEFQSSDGESLAREQRGIGQTTPLISDMSNRRKISRRKFIYWSAVGAIWVTGTSCASIYQLTNLNKTTPTPTATEPFVEPSATITSTVTATAPATATPIPTETITPTLTPGPMIDIGFPVAPEAANPFNLQTGDVDGVFFAGGFGDDYIRYAASLVHKLHPGIQVNVQGIQNIAEKLGPRFKAGNPPDVIDNSGANMIYLSDLANQDELADLAELLDAPSLDTPGKKFGDTLIPNSQNSAMFNGKQLGMNIAYTVSGIWYSRPAFEKAGYEYPTTWADMLTLCGQIKRDHKAAPWIYQGIYPYYIWGIVLAPLIFYSGGAEAFRKLDNLEPNAWKDPAVLRAVTDLYQLWDKDFIMKGSAGLNNTQAQTEWLKGSAVFLPCGNWIENEMRPAIPGGFEMVVQNVPGYADGQGTNKTVNAAGGETYIIPSNAKNPKGGLEFLRCLLSKASARYFAENVSAIMPVIGGSVGANVSTAVQSAVDLLNRSNGETMLFNLPNWYSDISKDLGNFTGELMTGKKNPEQFCAAMQKSADSVAADPDIPKFTR
jgi:N-acetylglucosamine transport system substrate-binding protein